jgi:hypothetical protein
MKRDWSATRQAEENLAVRQMTEVDQKRIDSLKEEIKRLDVILSDMNDLKHITDDVITSIRLLGAHQTILKRELHLATT